MRFCCPLPRWLVWTLGLCVLVGLVAPLLILWLSVWRYPSLTPHQVQERLASQNLVLIDVRDKASFERCHITGSIPLSQMPKDGAVALVCDDGLQSAQVTAKLRAQGREAYTLEGGLGGWIAAGIIPPPLTIGLTSQGREGPIPVLNESLWKQWLLVITGLILKPLYMILAALAAWLLRPATSPGLMALRRSLWCFFAGESFCAIDYWLFGGTSFFFDWLHGAGMVVAISFGVWFVMLLAHQHLLGEAGKPCVLQDLCKPCTKSSVCRIDRTLLLTWGTLALLAWVPFTVQPIAAWVSLTTIVGTPYAYTHDMARQLLELRYLPIVGMFLLLVSLPWVLRARNPIASVWLAAAAGPIVFGCFRLVLIMVWRDDPVWFLAWEEIGEFANIVALWWWMPAILRSLRSPSASLFLEPLEKSE